MKQSVASTEYDQSEKKWQSTNSDGMDIGNVVGSNVQSIAHIALCLTTLGSRPRGRPKRKWIDNAKADMLEYDDLLGLSQVVEKDQTCGPRATLDLMPDDDDCNTGRSNADLGDLGRRVLNPQMRDGKPQAGSRLA